MFPQRSCVRAHVAAVLILLVTAGCGSRSTGHPVAPEPPPTSPPPGSPPPGQSPPPDEAVYRLGEGDGALFAIIAPGLVRSVDGGATWTLAYPVGATDIATLGTGALAANSSGCFYSWDGFHWSWTRPESGLPPARKITDLVVQNGVVFATGAFSGVYRSRDRGSNWELAATGLPDDELGNLASDGSTLLVGSTPWRSTDGGDTWTPAARPGTPNLGQLAGANGRFYLARWLDGVYVSDDGGLTWARTAADPPAKTIDRIAAFGSDVFIMTPELYKSADGGASWTRLQVGGTKLPWVFDVVEKNGVIFAATAAEGVQRSTDGGATWTRMGFTGGEPWTYPAWPTLARSTR